MEEVLAPMIKLIDKIGYRFGHDGLMTCPGQVIWKGIETALDMHRIDKGLTMESARGVI